VPLLALVLAGSSTNLCYQFLAGGLGPAKRGVFKRLMAFQMGVGNVFMAK
jgi:hypothetical protein